MIKRVRLICDTKDKIYSDDLISNMVSYFNKNKYIPVLININFDEVNQNIGRVINGTCFFNKHIFVNIDIEDHLNCLKLKDYLIIPYLDYNVDKNNNIIYDEKFKITKIQIIKTDL